ncbi:MAG TPA: type VI secretion system baseplate subunit TssK [Candidatus Sulfopaludibacter sp.]|nr:type VI secretion system baseplate subunit TssK [Candidatus Sulfopaludibacter sp.]
MVWNKGMYLAPQHLQQTDRSSAARLAFWMEASPLPAWGFLDLTIDEEALAAGSFAINAAQGIFRDGSIFSIPESDPVPRVLALEEWFSPTQDSLEIQIGVSRDTRGGAAGGRYVMEAAPLADEGTGEEIPVFLAAVNIRVMAKPEANPLDETLDCARVIRGEAGVFRLDATFAPPCLQMAGSATLVRTLRSVVKLLASTRGGLLRNSGASAGAEQLRRDLLLRDLNSELAALLHMFHSGRDHPETVYRSLVQTAATLSLGSPTFDPSAIPEYDHAHPGESLRWLAETIRQLAAGLTA